MRPARLRRILAAVGAGGILAATGLAWAGEAHATPMSYLQSLNQHGVTITDTADALTVGYTACTMLQAANGAVVAEQLWLYTDIPTRAMAATVVVVAAEELCPEQDHRGERVA